MDVAELLEAVRRTCIPEVLLPEDLALVLHLSVAEAERLMKAGDFGKVGEAAGRPVLLRKEFLAALARLAKAAR